MREDELREALAAYAHNAWSGWMIYLFSKCTEHPGGFYTIPVWAVKRWKRQMDTNYCDLPEEEKQSDREEADRILSLVGADVGRLRATLHALAGAVEEDMAASSAFHYHETLENGTRANKAVRALIEALAAARAALTEGHDDE